MYGMQSQMTLLNGNDITEDIYLGQKIVPACKKFIRVKGKGWF
jgi:hypothetical protein